MSASTWIEEDLERQLEKSKEVASRLNVERQKYSGNPEYMDKWALMFDAKSCLDHLTIHIQRLQSRIDLLERHIALLKDR